jgi:hypothetical protein
VKLSVGFDNFLHVMAWGSYVERGEHLINSVAPFPPAGVKNKK